MDVGSYSLGGRSAPRPLQLWARPGFKSAIDASDLMSSDTDLEITSEDRAGSPLVSSGKTDDLIRRINSRLLAKNYILRRSDTEDSVSDRPEIRELTFFYLQNDLELEKRHLDRIVQKYPWVLYLRVDRNLKPTVQVLTSFGFKKKDIRELVQKVPSILAINHEWSLPEKLLSLQKMYSLSKGNLVKIVVRQPYLLTSSINRNYKVSTFFSQVMALSTGQTVSLVQEHPSLTMKNYNILTECWDLLLDVYGLDEREARSMCLHRPGVLSRNTLLDYNERVVFFTEELNSPPPFSGIQKMILRFPEILFIDIDIFLRPNIMLLKEYLQAETEEIQIMLQVFPQLLGYNPNTLEYRILQKLYLLTGISEYNEMLLEREADNDFLRREKNNVDDEHDDDDSDEPIYAEDKFGGDAPPKVYDLIRETVLMRSSPSETVLLLSSSATYEEIIEANCFNLNLDVSKAQKSLRYNPWILVYRLERTHGVLHTLAVTLGLTTQDLSRMVSIYPRLLSLRPADGKLNELLVFMAESAAEYLQKAGDFEEPLSYDYEGKDSDATVSSEYSYDFVNVYRSNTIRSMVRFIVLQYPLLLGTSMTTVKAKMGLLLSHGLQWVDFNPLLRKSAKREVTFLEEGGRGRRGEGKEKPGGVGAGEPRKKSAKPKRKAVITEDA